MIKIYRLNQNLFDGIIDGNLTAICLKHAWILDPWRRRRDSNPQYK